MLTALMCGGRFAIVTLGPALRPLLERAAVALGCAGRLDAIHILDTGTDAGERRGGRHHRPAGSW